MTKRSRKSMREMSMLASSEGSPRTTAVSSAPASASCWLGRSLLTAITAHGDQPIADGDLAYSTRMLAN